MNEVLSWDEIERRYPDEWVLLVDEVLGEEFPVTAGRVEFHTPERQKMEEHAAAARIPEFGIYFTGTPVTSGLVAVL